MSVTTSVQLKDPTNATEKKTLQSAPLQGDRILEFRVGKINGVPHAWTRVTNAKSGDEIWINSNVSGSWKSYGRRTIQAGGRNYTDAMRYDANDEVLMQAWTKLKGDGEFNTKSC